MGANRYSVATGNWNATITWSATSGAGIQTVKVVTYLGNLNLSGCGIKTLPASVAINDNLTLSGTVTTTTATAEVIGGNTVCFSNSINSTAISIYTKTFPANSYAKYLALGNLPVSVIHLKERSE